MNADVFDLCIIGAGMYGSAAARHASANPCLKVCLIGPSEPKSGGEWSSRDIHSSHYDEGRLVLTADESWPVQVLCKNSIRRYRELERMSGIQFYNPVGTLVIAERNSAHLRNWMEMLHLKKTPFVDLSCDNVFRKRFPYMCLEEGDFPFFDDNGAGRVNPRKMVEAEKKVALAQGCTMLREVVEEVSHINEQGLHEIVTQSGKRVLSKRLLFCTGAFTKFKNLHPVKNLTFSIHRETAAMLKVSPEEANRLSSMPCILKYKDRIADMPASVSGSYILPPIQYPDKNYYLKIGPNGHHRDSEIQTLEEARQWYNHKGDEEVLDKLPNVLHQLLPGLKVDAVESMTCITSHSPSGLPYIDRICPTVTVAVVGNGTGATICEEVGRVAAELSATGRWDTELPQNIFEAIFE